MAAALAPYQSRELEDAPPAGYGHVSPFVSGRAPACGAPADAYPAACTVARTDTLTFTR